MKGRSGRGLQPLFDVEPVVGELRLFKSKEELVDLKRACEISAAGHLAAMRTAKPGRFEYEVQAAIESEFKMNGAERVGYNSIVGRGPNATILHYVYNQDKCLDGDLMLVDAGAEYHYLTGDITRTFPVNGKFTKAQAKFYSAVLEVQKSCLKMIKPGLKYQAIHDHAVEALTEGMLELGLLKGSLRNLIQNKSYAKYYPHGTGHWLGMDVHDSGLYQIDGESRRLEAGMCFTVEPGLYVPANDKSAPKEFRGLGVRIEDNVHVTPKGCDVLTTHAPKDIDAIEEACQG
jgi:Xaa-Pro aminopeptidase